MIRRKTPAGRTALFPAMYRSAAVLAAAAAVLVSGCGRSSPPDPRKNADTQTEYTA